jgi:uncharacterized tellurite resistance protein B-like protein
MTGGAKMLDIESYPWQKRTDYLLMVAAVAAADGALPQEEVNLLNRWMDSFKLSEKSREKVLAAARQGLEELEPIERRLANTDLVYSLILDMMGMAMVDGVLQDKEIVLLGEVAGRLEVDPIDFAILIEFVHSAHQASLLSNPEPLYEHNIQSAFQLLRERKVRLFPHTLLCATSRAYDEELKTRWFSFNAH